MGHKEKEMVAYNLVRECCSFETGLPLLEQHKFPRADSTLLLSAKALHEKRLAATGRIGWVLFLHGKVRASNDTLKVADHRRHRLRLLAEQVLDGRGDLIL